MAVVKPVGASISMCLFTVTSFGSELAEFSTRHEAAVANLFEKFNSYYELRPPNSTDWIIEHSVIVIKKNTRFRKGSVSQNSIRHLRAWKRRTPPAARGRTSADANKDG
jgi:hypothetical protein